MSWNRALNQARSPSAPAWWLLKRSLIRCYQEGWFGIAKAAAYSGLLSFIPVLTATAALLVQLNAERVSQIISRFLVIAVPPGTEDFVRYSFTIRGERPFSVLIVALLVSVWAASGLMTTLIEGFHAAYQIPVSRPFLRQRLVAVLLVFIAAAPAILASVLIVAGDHILGWLARTLGLLAHHETPRGPLLLVSLGIRYGFAVTAVVVAAAGLFYFGPNRKQSWRNLWPGAILATALWLLSTAGFGWYVRHIGNYNVLYGGIGAAIALLVWMYLLALIALLGCAYNAERERFFSLPSTPARSTPAPLSPASLR
ncbi:MAG: YihY/virulence factor BrkB family protein [Bryobacteraceae bacterium]|nr:YihY/virulence factor BrkB family protein [Bryobacteraceae bacterium]MDW8379975.1 YihY/virulence factor BrkB family protein [Bryobacterales bacterium]